MIKNLTKSDCLNTLIGYCFLNSGLVPYRNFELYSILRTRWNNKYSKSDLMMFMESDSPDILIDDFKSIFKDYCGFKND